MNFTEKAKEWEYSSFKKFVKMRYYDENWFNFEDLYFGRLKSTLQTFYEKFNYTFEEN